MRSPFKFLEAYGKADKEIFFGREEEIELLYQMSYQTNLMLVYGMSGTGKTSLVQCGLAAKFETTDWFDLVIRRKGNLNTSFVEGLKMQDREGSFEEGFTIQQMIHSLYLDYLRPIYLIFDQFEELFILGNEKEEQEFVKTIAELLKADLPLKIIIVIREEYLGQLSNFEKTVPQLFDKRLRVEPMSRGNAQRVIVRTLKSEQFNISLSNDSVADLIIDKVTEGMGRVQLTYLQVFLDKLYQVAYPRNPDQVVFDEKLVNEVGRIEDVLKQFLDEQLDVFAQEVDSREQGMKWLKHFVSEKGTKMPVKRSELEKAMPELSKIQQLNYLEFFVNRRILRPLDSDQYELVHDSLAFKLSQTRTAGIPIPALARNENLPANPFPGFAPYTQDMYELFFGRETEVKELFEKVVNDTEIRTTLLFGPIGVGKTSLVKAGLLSRIEPLFKTAYLAFSREVFEQKLFFEITTLPPTEQEVPKFLELCFGEDWAELSKEERKVIVIDQLEELFIWVPETAQLENCYRHLARLVSPEFNCDLVLVVRDEFFATLQDLETYTQGILEEQMRLKHLDRHQAQEVIQRSAEYAGLEIEPDAMTQILRSVTEGDGKIILTYLQLYMDRLYQSLNPKVEELRN